MTYRPTILFKFRIAAFVIIVLAISTSQSYSQQSQPGQNAKDAPVPAPIQSIVLLAPSNSQISFVGTHVGEDPKPRLGGFSQFQGHVIVDRVNNAIGSIEFDIQVDSVWTEFDNLTSHLKNADFFDSKNFPVARFQSTEIKAGKNGQCKIKGNLTLHGKTNSIKFPANYRFENGGLILTTKLHLDRSEFGMDQLLSGVEKLVEIEFTIGQKTPARKTQTTPADAAKK